jgi:DNA-binding response OmpR family regulator
VLGVASDEWERAGMDALLTKPFNLDDLESCISSLLGASDRTLNEASPSMLPI